MSKKLSIFISTVFHPVFTNLLSLWLLFILYPQLAYGIQSSIKLFYISFVFVTTGLIPLLLVLILRLLGKSTSIMLHEKEERNLPYIITAGLYLLDFYFAQKTGTPQLLTAYLLACSSIIVAVLIINQFNKISIHMASMGALVGLIMCATPYAVFDLRYLLITAFMASGWVASARLFADAHTFQQVLSGFCLGLLIMLLIL